MKPPPFLTAQWRSLLMFNYEIDPQVLIPHLPHGLELDYWQEKTYVSVVGFLFWNTRVLKMAIPMHRHFPEVNLRFYVKRNSPEGVRRGVCFIREIVPRPAISFVANTLYGENYVALPMNYRASLAPADGDEQIEYSWRFKQRWNGMKATTTGNWNALEPASQEEFIAEHYWGYAKRRSGGATEYRVAHPRWRVKDVREAALDCDVEQLYGVAFVPFLSGPPASAFLADGSPIAVYRGTCI